MTSLLVAAALVAGIVANQPSPSFSSTLHSQPCCGTDEGAESAHNPLTWPGGIIYYEFGPGITPDEQANFLAGLTLITDVCDAVFVPRTGQASYITIERSTTPGLSLSTSIGRAGGQQFIRIWDEHWVFPGLIAHEMMHAMGFYHEQSRADRDQFIEIVLGNAQPGTENNFAIVGGASLNGPYDFASIMHYGPITLSRGGRTVRVRPPFDRWWQHRIGHWNAMSNGDVWALTALYGGAPPPREVVLVSPPPAAVVGADWPPHFTWQPAQGADSYRLLVDDDADFSSPEIDVDLLETSYTHPAPLAQGRFWYWRVEAVSAAGTAGPLHHRPHFAFFTGATPAATLYVDAAAPAGGDGSSWAQAFRRLDDALLVTQELEPASGSRYEVRVAGGVYTPGGDSPDMNDDCFVIPARADLLGGFAGAAAPDPDARDPLAWPTILSGDLLGNDGPDFATRSDNCQRVAYVLGIDPISGRGPLISGLTFRAGNSAANRPGITLPFFGHGSGLLLDDTIAAVEDCTFTDHDAEAYAAVLSTMGRGSTVRRCTMVGNRALFLAAGAGVVWAPSTVFESCTFADNSSGHFAGAVGAEGSSFGLVNGNFNSCRFLRNSAAEGAGAAVVLTQGAGGGTSGTTVFNNCLFAENFAGVAGFGGAIHVETGRGRFVNCTFSGNDNLASDFSGTLSQSPVANGLFMRNCIVWGDGPQPIVVPGNPDVQFSLIEGGFPGNGNLNADPRFANAVASDFSLLDGSPAIDAGRNSDVPLFISLDLAGNPRLIDDPATPDTGVGSPPLVDLGAFEWQHSTRCEADLTTSSDPNDPSYGLPDGNADAADFFYFLDQFTSGNLAQADLTGSSDPFDPAYGIPDGALDAADFFYFLDAFVAGCP